MPEPISASLRPKVARFLLAARFSDCNIYSAERRAFSVEPTREILDDLPTEFWEALEDCILLLDSIDATGLNRVLQRCGWSSSI